MTREPSVSILTACLNAKYGLRRTIQSVAEQTFANLQHVVIDGGSSDGSVNLLEAAEGIEWISEPDEGIAHALNKGLSLATGEWILVLQADDRFETRDSLRDAAVHLSDDFEIVSFDVAVPGALRVQRYASRGFSIRTAFKTTIPHQGALVRRSLVDEIGGFDESLRVALDYEFFLAAWHRGARVKVVGEVLAVMPRTGLSARSDWRSLWARFAEERQIIERFKKGTPWVGGFLGLSLGLALLLTTINKRREVYEPDQGKCYSCGRCFEYCPIHIEKSHSK